MHKREVYTELVLMLMLFLFNCKLVLKNNCFTKRRVDAINYDSYLVAVSIGRYIIYVIVNMITIGDRLKRHPRSERPRRPYDQTR